MMARHLILSLLPAALLCLPMHASAADALVLVASKDGQVKTLTSLEIRKLYLGFIVIGQDDRRLFALTNASDEHLMDIFLQNVMAMTRRAYNRRLLMLTVQSGRTRPPVYPDLNELQQAVHSNPTAVTCMWRSDALAAQNLKIIKVLWRE